MHIARHIAGLLLVAALLASSGATAQGRKKPRIIPGMDGGGIAVALIDSGVNYTLPGISERLARDGEGDIIGLDLPDGDNRPFDDTPPGALAVTRPHGTALASVLIGSSNARVVPIRAPLSDARAIAYSIAMAARTPARIVAVRLDGVLQADLAPIRAALAAHPQVLVIMSAAMGGQDLDAAAPGIAALRMANVLIVTLATSTGTVPANANHGARSVDLAVFPGIPETADVAGRPIAIDSPGFEAAALSGFAARMASTTSSISAQDLRKRILGVALPLSGAASGRTAVGWLDLRKL